MRIWINQECGITSGHSGLCQDTTRLLKNFSSISESQTIALFEQILGKCELRELKMACCLSCRSKCSQFAVFSMSALRLEKVRTLYMDPCHFGCHPVLQEKGFFSWQDTSEKHATGICALNRWSRFENWTKRKKGKTGFSLTQVASKCLFRFCALYVNFELKICTELRSKKIKYVVYFTYFLFTGICLLYVLSVCVHGNVSLGFLRFPHWRVKCVINESLWELTTWGATNFNWKSSHPSQDELCCDKNAKAERDKN